MKTPLEQALDYSLANEGGFSDNPADYGGATKWGITREDASRWRRRPVSVQEMRDFPQGEAKQIYEAWYWKPIGCNQILATNVAICMFDIGVVRGIGSSAIYAQQVCNGHGLGLVVDGHIGPKSLAAINQMNPSDFIKDFEILTERGFHQIVSRNPSQVVFLQGWLNRAHRLLTLV